MTVEALLARLDALQLRLLQVVERLGDREVGRQFHPVLSPLGWHLAHCAFLECHWIRDIVAGDDRQTAGLDSLYLPWLAPKDRRGAKLPPREALLEWARQVMAENRALLGAQLRGTPRHRLLDDGYLAHFLIQHHAQHLETMDIVLGERALAGAANGFEPALPLVPAEPRAEFRAIPAGCYAIGAEAGFAFDNERPAQRVTLAGFAIAARPVSNAEYLAFMHAGGYDSERWWSPAGWRWRSAWQVTHPHHWRAATDGPWFALTAAGAADLSATAAVEGVSRHEAGAFARWAGARLPHEYEWEAARRAGALDGAGEAWEWCANPFHPYPGFRAHPYREYSRPWYDTRHFVLRGGGARTAPEIKRPSYRNYYTADSRHIFAGLRLAH